MRPGFYAWGGCLVHSGPPNQGGWGGLQPPHLAQMLRIFSIFMGFALKCWHLVPPNTYQPPHLFSGSGALTLAEKSIRNLKQGVGHKGSQSALNMLNLLLHKCPVDTCCLPYLEKMLHMNTKFRQVLLSTRLGSFSPSQARGKKTLFIIRKLKIQ